MTPFQQQCLDIIKRLNAAEFSDWFNPSEIMATIQVESTFRPRAIRHEPSGVTSYGLMQVLDSTAAGLGLHGLADQMFDPEIGIRYGMRAHKANWVYLERRLHREPDYEEWSAAYNEGAGNVLKGHKDVAYTSVWIKAQEFWAPLVDEAAP